jgi:hypothetical protein
MGNEAIFLRGTRNRRGVILAIVKDFLVAVAGKEGAGWAFSRLGQPTSPWGRTQEEVEAISLRVAISFMPCVELKEVAVIEDTVMLIHHPDGDLLALVEDGQVRGVEARERNSRCP